MQFEELVDRFAFGFCSASRQKDTLFQNLLHRGGLAAVLDVWPCFAHRMQVVTALAIWGWSGKGLDHLVPALGV